MKKQIIYQLKSGILILLIFFGLTHCKKDSLTNSSGEAVTGKIYVANEDGESISVIDASNLQNVTSINVADGSGDMLMVHNVQVAPDGKTIWATVNPMSAGAIDQVVVIDQSTGTIKKRIYVGAEYHLAHVILDKDCKNAFVTATDSNKIIQIETVNYSIVKTFTLSPGHAPHGIRYFNGKLFVANMNSKSLSIIDVGTGLASEVALGGIAVQTAVVPNGKYVFVSLYDTREVVRYDVQTGQVIKIELPAVAQGPIQLYSTPDSKKLFVCDQGKLNGMPVSNKVFLLDVEGASVLSTITVGNAAHGVVVSKDGKTAYVTNSDDNTVSVIDVNSQSVRTTVSVGLNPNGIGFWYSGGGMP